MMYDHEKSDPRHSSCEANEQSRATGRGVGGAKGGGRGECEPAKHGPGTVPGTVSQALKRMRNFVRISRRAVTHPRGEPCARIGLVRICAGGAW